MNCQGLLQDCNHDLAAAFCSHKTAQCILRKLGTLRSDAYVGKTSTVQLPPGFLCKQPGSWYFPLSPVLSLFPWQQRVCLSSALFGRAGGS